MLTKYFHATATSGVVNRMMKDMLYLLTIEHDHYTFINSLYDHGNRIALGIGTVHPPMVSLKLNQALAEKYSVNDIQLLLKT